MNIDFQYVPKHYAARTHEKMQEVLLHPTAVGPSIHYYMIRGSTKQRNITVWEPGLVGDEYIKTYGHYHVGQLEETYWISFGEGIALEQKRQLNSDGQPIDNSLESFKATPVKAGDSIHFSSGHGHLLVNTGPTFFVTADDSPVYFDDPDPAGLPGHADYNPIKKLHGFAYYVVENEGKPALRKNPNYLQIDKQDLADLPVLV